MKRLSLVNRLPGRLDTSWRIDSRSRPGGVHHFCVGEAVYVRFDRPGFEPYDGIAGTGHGRHR